MVSAKVENIRKSLAELHCSVLQFSKIAHFSQPRLAEMLRGAREMGPYQAKFFEETLKEMASLQRDVRAHVGHPIHIVWTSQIWDVLEHRRKTGKNDFSVGITYPEGRPGLKPAVLSGQEALCEA
jgi:hypothetical protein